MRNRYVFTSIMPIALLLGACGPSEADIEAVKETVAARSKAVAAAEAARDIETAISFWADDAIIQTHGAVQAQGKDAIRQGMQAFFDAFKEFEGTTTHLEVAASGDMAYEYGVNRVVLPGAEGDLLAMGKYLLVWRKIDGVWLISAISVTDDAASPAPM